MPAHAQIGGPPRRRTIALAGGHCFVAGGAGLRVVVLRVDLVVSPLRLAHKVDVEAGVKLFVVPVGIERGTHAWVVVIANGIAIGPTVAIVEVVHAAAGNRGRHTDVQPAPFAQIKAAACIHIKPIHQGAAFVLVLANHAGDIAHGISGQHRRACDATTRIRAHRRQCGKVGTVGIGDGEARLRDDFLRLGIIRRSNFIATVDEPPIGRHRQPLGRLEHEAQRGNLGFFRLQIRTRHCGRLAHGSHRCATLRCASGCRCW